MGRGRSGELLNNMEASYEVHSGVKTAAGKQLALKGDMPMCFKYNNVDVAAQTAKGRMEVAADNLAASFPSWSKGNSVQGTGQDGEWRHDRGPPYVMRLTLFSGDGVDTVGSGTLVRRILGLKTAFGKPCDLRSCKHAWSNNNYMSTFDGPQFRFLYRNMCSVLVVPPLTNGAGPILSENGMFRLHHFLNEGHNTMIVLGGVANVLFLNQNYVSKDGGLTLEPDWVEGPYEAQATAGVPNAKGTPFESLSVTLPSPGTSVVGAKISSLPQEAISYYEAQDVSVVFEIPTKQGRILYIGYDYSEPVTPWIHTLIAATSFPDFGVPTTMAERAAKRAAGAAVLKSAGVGGLKATLLRQEAALEKQEAAESKREKMESDYEAKFANRVKAMLKDS